MQDQQNEFRNGRGKTQQIIKLRVDSFDLGGGVFGEGYIRALEDRCNSQT